MLRWTAIVIVVLLAAAAGFMVGRMGKEAPQASAPVVQRRDEPLGMGDVEARTLAQEKANLEERLQQVLKEQERLAQENEILRKQQATTQVLGTTRDALPDIPPK